MNPMRTVRVEKATLNIGTGKNQDKMEKALQLLQKLTEREPKKTITQKRIATWGIRPGLPIGAKVTLRGEEAQAIIKRILEAKENVLGENNFDSNGNISFGLQDYIDVPGIKYDPEIGSLGFQICITLERPGFRIKRRKVQKRKLPKHHKITKEEAITFMKENYSVNVGGEE